MKHRIEWISAIAIACAVAFAPVIALFGCALLIGLFSELPKRYSTLNLFILITFIFLNAVVYSSRTVGASPFDDMSYSYYPQYLEIRELGLFKHLDNQQSTATISRVEIGFPLILAVLSSVPIKLSENGLIFAIMLLFGLGVLWAISKTQFEDTRVRNIVIAVTLFLCAWGISTQTVRQSMSCVFVLAYLTSQKRRYIPIAIFFHLSAVWYFGIAALSRRMRLKTSIPIAAIAALFISSLANYIGDFAEVIDKAVFYRDMQSIEEIRVNYQILPISLLIIALGIGLSRPGFGVPALKDINRHATINNIASLGALELPLAMFRLNTLYTSVLPGLLIGQIVSNRKFQRFYPVLCAALLYIALMVLRIGRDENQFGLLKHYAGINKTPFYYIGHFVK